MTDVTADPGLAVFFSVRVDWMDLGAFSRCEGLAMEMQVQAYEEGGVNGFVRQLPGRITFPNVRLTRPLQPDSQKLALWLHSMVQDFKRTTAEITARTSDGMKLVQWHLGGVIPVRWQGPSFVAGGSRVAEETLELAHHGFVVR